MSKIDDNDFTSVDQYIHDYMLFLDGDGGQPHLDALSPEERAEAAVRVRILQPPAGPFPASGARARIARELGFDRVGTTIAVDGQKLKRARQRQGVELKDLAARVTAAGAPVRTADLLHVEKHADARLPQEVVTRLVAVLALSVADVEAEFEAKVTELRRLLDSPRIEEVIAQWARDFGRDLRTVRGSVHDRVLTAKFRAESIDEDQLVDIVRAILRTMEP